ncbi:MAG: L-seryl-tRNA(Sec) selenium transferase [Candidatus Krumholzibacteriia bacterium]
MSDPALRLLPPVGALLEDPRLAPLAGGRRRAWLTRLVQRAVAAERAALAGRADGPDAGAAARGALHEAVVARVLAERARLLRPALRRVINATGVVVHTNLGRAPYPAAAVARLVEAARSPCDLEYRLDTGARGHRGRGVEEKAALLAGAEDALVVNNNAAALWLAVRATAGSGRVILSRGEIVAIGGSFRLDEILRETGGELVEVGTTNRTVRGDYERALAPGAVVLKVHRSNFAQRGFVEEVALPELAALCRERGHVLIYDAGSGSFYPAAALGLPDEPTLADDLAAGPDLVTCSGDKLLGGGQAGLVLGRADLMAALRRHPLRRALRVDKLTLAALDAVLTLYLGADGLPPVPVLEMLALDPAVLEARGRDLLAALLPAAPAGWRGEVVAGESSVGGGSFSEAVVPTRLLRWRGPKGELESCHAALRRQDPAVVTRINQEGLAIDLRTVAPEELPEVASALRRCWRGGGEGAA